MSGSWTPATLSTIVEGVGEVRALPNLLYRIAAELGVAKPLIPLPRRLPRGDITKVGGIENAVEAAALHVKGEGGVLVLLDADDDCPAQLGPQLLGRARSARTDKRVAVVLANREFEAWFLAAAPSLAGLHGFPSEFPRPVNPEAPRDCKGVLTRARPKGQPYEPATDQLPLVRVFDMKMAREHADSFDKFCRDIAWLLGAG
jgi:hypothetical protein